MKISNFKPFITGKEIDYIKDVLDRGFDMSGDGIYTKRVHSFLERRYKVPKVLLTTSGTTALEFAVRLLNLIPGDEIIVPSFTFSSTANAVLVSTGLKVVFVDVDPNTLNIDPKDIERKITNRTRAIIVVHYAGVACDMDRIMKIAKKNNLKVIEDAAQAIESKYKGRYLGTIGDYGCFSFHDTKNLTSGEGGALFINSDDKTIIERAEIVREKGTNRTKFFRGEVDKYTWVDIGSSYLPSDLLAAFLLAQLEQVEDITKRRLRAFYQYKRRLSYLEKKDVVKLPTIPSYAKHNAHIFYVLFKNEEMRDFVMNYLRKKGVKAPFHYIPLHSSPLGKSLGYQNEDMPVTEDISYRLIRLPMFAEITEKQIDYVIRQLENALNKYEESHPNVSVGISAFNEGKNIKNIITQVLKQRQENWNLKEVLVYSDGSSDKTVLEANKIKDSRLFVHEDQKRRGKSFRLNQIFRKATGDYLVLFDADIKLKDENVITTLVKGLRENEDVSLVGGNSRPIEPGSFFERAIYSTFLVFDESRKKIKDGNNIFGCTGSCLAMKKEFSKTLTIPEGVMNDDDFIYFSCILKGLKFKYIDSAVIYYKLPTKLKDYLKQVFRSNPPAVVLNFNQYFGEIVKAEYHRPIPFMLKSVFKAFLKNPLETLFVSAINLSCKPFFPLVSRNYKQSWFIAESTK